MEQTAAPASEAPSPAVLARRLLRLVPTACLATAASADGWPFASLVLLATDQDGAPLLLLSNLAEHTRNLKNDPRFSLLLDGTIHLASRLTGPRLTLLGQAEPSAAPLHRRRFLARHDDAADYAGFADFAIYRLRLERAHLVAGFGPIAWIEAGDLLAPPSPALAAAETDIVRHMNEDHREALAQIATRLLALEEGPWRMTGLDGEGFDLACGSRTARLDFEPPVRDPESARIALTQLTRRALELERI